MKEAQLPLEKKIPPVVVPEGYCGKILLISILAGEERLLALRSGGAWHREILCNAEAEIRALGFPEARVAPKGGAYLSFDADGSIFLWGRSDAFGPCDLHEVAALLKVAWPGRRIRGLFGEMP